MPSARAEKPSEFLVYQTGACEKARCSWATKACGRARIRAISARAARRRDRCRTRGRLLIGERRLDHQARRLRDHGVECGRLAAPPGRHRGQRQPLADELLARARAEIRATPPIRARRCRAHWRPPRCPCGWRQAVPARRAPNRRAAPPDRKNHRRACAKSHARASGPASVFRNTLSSRTVRSWPSTKGKPSWRARYACSK